MVIFKRFMLTAVIFAVLTVMASAQTRPGLTTGAPEMTVEQSYLQESIELMIIREQSRGEGREMKLEALDSIGNAISRGNRSAEIHSALEYISFEGIINPTRLEGRVINNHPDLRARAATYLGQLGTPEATNTLVRMVSADNEPMVITEAIKSLGIIGSNSNEVVVNTIAWTVNRFNTLNPDNQLVISAIEAFEKISAANGGQISPTAVQTLIRISEGSYTRNVQERARIALSDMRRAH